MFPLPLNSPLLRRDVIRPSGASGCRRGRLVDQALRSLNWLAGCDKQEELAWRPGVNRMHDEVMDYLDGLAADAVSREPIGESPSSQTSLSRLLRGRSVYDTGGTAARLTPFKLDKLSLPEDVSGCPFVSEGLQDDVRIFLEEPERMLRSQDDEVKWAPDEPYFDPIIKMKREKYLQLVRAPRRKGLVRFVEVPKEHVGLLQLRSPGGRRGW